MRRTRWMSPGLAMIMASLVVGLTWGAVAGGVSAAEFTQAELFVGAGAVAAEVPVSPCTAVARKPRFIDAVRG
jgi:hypothetical protein